MPDLPSGTVTFLFTDIEGSTALWERDRAAMREAVDRQLAILHSLITAHHGVLYKTVGDGTQAAFASAEEALRAALASQRALLAEDWAEPLGPLRVRMALHAGEAIPDARGDYLAAPLNRLSRLLSAGHGGQILLSQTVQQLSRGALPRGRAAGSGRASAARSAGARARLPAGAPGAAGRVPAPQVAGAPAEQPAATTDAVPRSGAGGGRGRWSPAQGRGSAC